jgi:hypothetical protein
VAPIHPELFYHDGRGPELLAVHWAGRGRVLKAVDFMPPDAESEAVWHVRFIRPQVVKIIPEEVIDYKVGGLGEALVTHSPTALFNAGKSQWFLSFAQRHLQACSHYRILLYDELFEVVAEDVKIEKGSYKENGYGNE